MLLVAASSTQAQTALLIVSHADDPDWVAHVRAAAASVQWNHGPVEVAFVDGSGPMEEAVDAVLGARVAERPAAAVIVPLSPDRGKDLESAIRAAVDGRPHSSPALRVGRRLDGFQQVGVGPLARAVERSAMTALAALLESGAIAEPGASGIVYRLAGINVTATREARETFATPRPVTVIGEASIRERAPANPADLFRDIPGLDVEGVGASQRRPMIRGLRGQRVLLLENGIRLNNSRRRLDSGEPPAISGVFELDRIEVVRGASSVLYGSDAIGGVVNLIPRRPRYPLAGADVGGALHYRYGSVGKQHGASGRVAGHVGRLAFLAGASYREASSYEAPAGSFGDLTLVRDTEVRDTGVEDHNVAGRLEYRFSPGHSAFARFERYRAREAGFGLVDPADLGSAGASVQIRFPDQKFDRVVLGYEGLDIRQPVADRASATAYWQDNEREFVTSVFAPFDVAQPDGPGVQIESANFTDIGTYGFRLEAAKLVGGRHTLTYGVEVHRDRSLNTDARSSTVTGFGPPATTTDSTPAVPNATLRSVGAFAQGALALGSLAELTLGLRYQDVRAKTIDTPGLADPFPAEDEADRTLVGTANLLYRLTDAVNLVVSVGRGFRSPNLIERFFSGATPEGTGVWTRNPRLGAETSLNFDLGARVQTASLYVEGFVFRNLLKDGIQLEQTDSIADGLPVFQNVNVSKMTITGIELTLGAQLGKGLSLGAGFTHLAGDNPDDAEDPVLEGYRDRVHAHVRYTDSRDRYWAEYEVRHNGSTDDVVPGLSPVGDLIPSFTVHAVRAGVRLLSRHRLGVAIENLSNSLYAEPTNVAFFRPEPKRGLTVTWTAEF
jgi:outer membrane receptor protein involved in Fe transport